MPSCSRSHRPRRRRLDWRAFTAEREAEWVEFVSECTKFDTEIAGEIAKEKFTLAELDEEEQNLDRLKRWYRDLRARDLFGAPSARESWPRAMKECAERWRTTPSGCTKRASTSDRGRRAQVGSVGSGGLARVDRDEVNTQAQRPSRKWLTSCGPTSSLGSTPSSAACWW